MDLQLQNSYIFIPNPYKKKEPVREKENGVIRIDVGCSLISYLKSAFPNAVKASEHPDVFKSEYTCMVEVDENSMEVKFLIHQVVDSYYLDIVVIGKRKAQIIKALEYIQAAIEKSDIRKGYIDIISYDAISEYYCNKIYPKLNEVERNLRKLLFNIYIVNFGHDYYQKTISSDLQVKIKRVIQAKGNNQDKEKERLQKFFYSMDFTDIKDMLFVPNWTEVDEKAKVVFLESHEDLSQLTDGELRKAFSEIAPRSDWERFFADKMDATAVPSLIDEIRISRNNIAHCKFFYKDEYVACSKAMGKFNKAVMSAIAITEDKDFTEKNSESIKNALAHTAKRFEEFRVSLLESLIPATQFAQRFSEMIAQIREPMLKNISATQSAILLAFQSLFRDSIPPNNLPDRLSQHPEDDEDTADNEDNQSNEHKDDSNN